MNFDDLDTAVALRERHKGLSALRDAAHGPDAVAALTITTPGGVVSEPLTAAELDTLLSGWLVAVENQLRQFGVEPAPPAPEPAPEPQA